MNKLLQRQIKKALGDSSSIPELCLPLIELINETYNHNDNDKKMLERVLEVTSEEMIKLNTKLKKESLEALDMAANRFTHATTAANIGIWEYDLVNNIVSWDETTYGLYGLSSASGIKETDAWEQFVHPEDLSMAKREMDNAIAGKKDFDIEYRAIWPDKSLHFLRTRGMIERDPSGKALKMIGSKWDLTERKNAQENIKREKELADSVINSLPVIFFLFTYEGKFLRWNKNLLDVTGYTEKEIVTMNPLDFFAHDEKEKMQNEIGLVIKNGQSDSEANLLSKKKKKIPYFFNSITINYEGQDCVIGTGTNIAERKKMEENLRAKNKDLEEFAHIVSHNLRAPIAKIQGLTTLINTDEYDSKENMGLLKYIKDEVVNLDKIIKVMNSIIREKEYVNFKIPVRESKLFSVRINNVYLIDDDPIVNVISKRTIEKAGFAKKICIHQDASSGFKELRKLSANNLEEFPEVIFLDINMPDMNGWEFLDEFNNFSDEVKEKCKIFMLTSSIDPSDIKKSRSYTTVKDFITKPLTKEKLAKLNF